MTEKILVIDDDLDTLRLVGLMLQRQSYQVSAASNGSQGLTKAFEERPDLILLDVMMPDMDGYEVTRRLRKNPATASIPILMFTAKTQLDDKVTGFEVGADDYLTKPTHPTELLSHVKALLARATPKSAEEMTTLTREKNGYLIGVISARAGVGVSTVAVNLGAAIHAQSKSDVIVAELTPGLGTTCLDLGLPPQTGLTDILGGATAEATREKVGASLVEHKSGVKVLAASENPRDVDLGARVENFTALAARLVSLGRYVVLDLGSGLPSYSQKLLAVCVERVIVMEGTANSIRHTKMLLDDFQSLKMDPKTISIVLNNRQRSEAQVPWKKAQEELGHPILTALTPVPELFLQAARLQTPAVVAQPSNMVAQQFIKIADGIIEREKAQ
ncbi:MAG: response regulator [Anaerolineales bacterium]|jgi:pilus assembly protein CpaE|nr:response regulator [Chloroflexota bacterium]MBK6644996.1 response regulator [Anaerolineales bacterium]MCC6987293.1 response regulator [Anaerolineales bacterium]